MIIENKMSEITKLRNAEGKICTCTNCGREITKLFQVGTKIYGSECVIALFGGDAIVKKMNGLTKIYSRISPSTIEAYKAAHKYNDEQMFSHFLRNGGLN